jgi:Concanavalin A-like lectin/glucanases superfamily
MGMLWLPAPRRVAAPAGPLAASFDGSAYLSIADAPQFSYKNTATVNYLSMTGWIFPTAAGPQYICGKAGGTAAAQVEYYLWYDTDNVLRFYFSDGTTIRQNAIGAGTVTQDAWNFVGFSANWTGTNNNINTHMNGTTTGQSPAAWRFQDGANAFRLGGVEGIGGFTGHIDAWGVFSEMYDEDSFEPEFDTIRNGTTGYNYAGLPAGDVARLHAWYDFNEAGGAATWADAHGSFDLTATGTVGSVAGKT